MDSQRLGAYLRLHLADGVGPVLFRRMVEAFGDVQQAAAASPRQWRGVEGVGDKTAAALAAVTDEQVDAEISEAGRREVRILCIEEADYPAALKAIADPPPVLYVRGRMEPHDAVAVAVVGSRRCTYYGLEQAQRFAELLGRAGFTVVSGGARGIDTAAHQGALAASGRTIAVMGCGLSQVYPEENAAMFEKIISAGRGALVSELPMNAPVLGRNFPTRNRIISGLSLALLVVEAARRSGSLITAKEAAEQGRIVFAVPGRIDSPLSQGSNQLIRNGAILVQDLEDILEHLGTVGEKMAPKGSDGAGADQAVPPGLDATEQKLFDALKHEALSLDDLVRRTGVASGPAASALTMLLLKGAVRQMPGNIFARRGAGTATGKPPA